jgi:hypothetical protein
MIISSQWTSSQQAATLIGKRTEYSRTPLAEIPLLLVSARQLLTSAKSIECVRLALCWAHPDQHPDRPTLYFICRNVAAGQMVGVTVHLTLVEKLLFLALLTH